MIFLYQEFACQPYTTIVSKPAMQNFSFMHVMSEMTIFDFFMLFFFGNKKAPPISGRANKKGDRIACLI